MKDEEASNYPPSLLPLDIFLSTLRFIVFRIRRDRSSVVRLVADEGQNDEEEPLFRRDFRRRFGRYSRRGELKKEIRASEGFVVHVFVRSFRIHSCLPTHVQFTIPSTSPSTLNSKSALSISFLHALSIFRQIKSMLDLFTGEGNEGAERAERAERGLGKEVEEKQSDSNPNPNQTRNTFLVQPIWRKTEDEAGEDETQSKSQPQFNSKSNLHSSSSMSSSSSSIVLLHSFAACVQATYKDSGLVTGGPEAENSRVRVLPILINVGQELGQLHGLGLGRTEIGIWCSAFDSDSPDRTDASANANTHNCEKTHCTTTPSILNFAASAFSPSSGVPSVDEDSAELVGLEHAFSTWPFEPIQTFTDIGGETIPQSKSIGLAQAQPQVPVATYISASPSSASASASASALAASSADEEAFELDFTNDFEYDLGDDIEDELDDDDDDSFNDRF
ncbi:hypothetical protein C8R42DRAFT_728452 [Lentinula raphanica]|nr:hypothetical protein C8R42DRAFT_728452 [Lentinula raphanica]